MAWADTVEKLEIQRKPNFGQTYSFQKCDSNLVHEAI